MNQRRELAWGQRLPWMTHQDLDPKDRGEANVVVAMDINSKTPNFELVRTLQHLVNVEETFRTSFQVGEDGVPKQVTDPPYVVELETIDLESIEEVDNVLAQLKMQPLDISCPNYTRFLKIRYEQKYKLAIITHHAILDGRSADILVEQVVRHAEDPSLETWQLAEIDGQQFEAQTQQESSRVEARRYFSRLLQDMPVDQLARRRAPNQINSKVHKTFFSSPTAADAVRSIAARNAAVPASVFDVVFGAVLSAYARIERPVYHSYVSNRHIQNSTNLLRNIAMPTLRQSQYRPDKSLTECLSLSMSSFFDLFYFGYFPFDELCELKSEIGTQRGAEVQMGLTLNFSVHSGSSGVVDRPLTQGDADWQALAEDIIFVVNLFDDGLTMELNARPSVMSLPDAKLFVKGIERCLFRWANNHDSPADENEQLLNVFSPPTDSDDWTLGANGWLNWPNTRQVFSSIPGVCMQSLAFDAQRLPHVYIGIERGVSLDQVRQEFLNRTANTIGVYWPDRVTINQHASGREQSLKSARSHQPNAYFALKQIIEGRLGHPVNMHRSYVQNGGRLLIAPAIVNDLKAAGLSGIRSSRFWGVESLAWIANSLNDAEDTVV